MATMVERFLDIAEQLIASNPRSSAARRRTVSTAYYAAFHSLAQLCADELLPDVEAGSLDYERVYRALEHGTLKTAFRVEQSPLRQRPSLRQIGDLIVPLRTERFRADYLPPMPGVFTRTKAEELIAQARSLVRQLEALGTVDRRSLATYLLFKDIRT
jgi:hypothetical protein